MYFATEQCFYDKTLKSSEKSVYNGTRHLRIILALMVYLVLKSECCSILLKYRKCIIYSTYTLEIFCVLISLRELI